MPLCAAQQRSAYVLNISHRRDHVVRGEPQVLCGAPYQRQVLLTPKSENRRDVSVLVLKTQVLKSQVLITRDPITQLLMIRNLAQCEVLTSGSRQPAIRHRQWKCIELVRTIIALTASVQLGAGVATDTGSIHRTDFF